MSTKHNDAWTEYCREMQEEAARDSQIAQDAISRLYRGESITKIDAEPLEALAALIGAELQDRDYRTRERSQKLLEQIREDYIGINLPF